MERNKDFVYLGAFIWDTRKNEYNKANYKGLSFELAARIFNDPLLYSDYDYIHSTDEHREKFIGKLAGRYIISVIATDKEGLIRIISARKANSKEVKLYEQNAKKIQGY